MTKEEKLEIIKKYGTDENDSGKSEVQILTILPIKRLKDTER
jgi:ribosomal protein S15P/S13E